MSDADVFASPAQPTPEPRCARCEQEPVAWPGAVSGADCIAAARAAIAANPGRVVLPSDVERERRKENDAKAARTPLQSPSSASPPA